MIEIKTWQVNKLQRRIHNPHRLFCPAVTKAVLDRKV